MSYECVVGVHAFLHEHFVRAYTLMHVGEPGFVRAYALVRVHVCIFLFCLHVCAGAYARAFVQIGSCLLRCSCSCSRVLVYHRACVSVRVRIYSSIVVRAQSDARAFSMCTHTRERRRSHVLVRACARGRALVPLYSFVLGFMCIQSCVHLS